MEIFFKKVNKERIGWVDIYKGICIMLMVSGHAGSPLNTYIYLFHMPAFMLLSGYTYNGSNYRYIEYIKHKLISFIVPFCIINILYILFYVILQYLGLYHYLQVGIPIDFFLRIKYFFLNMSTPDFAGATWFILVLFTIEVIFESISRLCKMISNEKNNVILALTVGLLGWLFINKKIILPYLIDLSMYGCIFYSLGVLLRRYNILESKIDHKLMIIFSSLLTVFFGSFYFFNELPMNWPTRSFSPILIQIISFVSAAYLCYLLSKIVEKLTLFNKLFTFIGKSTYTILIMHFFIFRIIFLILVLFKVLPISYLQQLTPSYSIYPGWILLTIITVICCLCISKISEKNTILNYIFNAKIKRRNNE